MAKILNVFLVLSILVVNTGYSQKQASIRQVVKKNYPKNNVYIGATSSYKKMGTKESEILAKEFSYVTPANDFKQSAVHPNNEKWRWEQADAWIKFAEKHNQVIRIHGPISPQSSRWARNDSRTVTELETNLREYTTALYKRYNNEKCVKWVDVINETVSRGGGWKIAESGDSGWEMPWEKIGYTYDVDEKYEHLNGKVPLYILQAFKIANEHATNKKLIINQHAGMESGVWNKIKDLVLYLREQGYRVDGIGWQAHISTTRDNEWETPEVSLNKLKELIQWAHANNLEFHITEFNMHVPLNDINDVENQVRVTSQIFNTVLEMRGTGVVTWNFWTMQDKIHYKNKRKYMIGLWDNNYAPKQNYFVVKSLLENPPPLITK